MATRRHRYRPCPHVGEIEDVCLVLVVSRIDRVEHIGLRWTVRTKAAHFAVRDGIEQRVLILIHRGLRVRWCRDHGGTTADRCKRHAGAHRPLHGFVPLRNLEPINCGPTQLAP